MTRRGSTGDSSDNDFSDVGGGSDTDASSGVTGDDGSDTSYGGGSTDESTAGSGNVSGPGAGGGDDDDGDQPDSWGNSGDDSSVSDSDTDYDPNPSRRETGGTDDQTIEDIDGTTDQPQSTGDEPSQNQGGAGGDATTDEFDATFDDELTADRGVSVTTIEGADAPSKLERSSELRDELGQEQSRAEQREQIAAQLAREYDVARENVRVGQGTGDQEFEAVIVEDEQAFEEQTAVTGAPDEVRPDPEFEQIQEGGDARLANAAEDDGPRPVEGGDVRLANAAEDDRDTSDDPTPESGGDARLQQIADEQDVDLRAIQRTAEEPLNYGRRAKYRAGIDVLMGSTDEALGRAMTADSPAAAADALAGSTDEAIGRAARASAAGNRARAADNLAGGLDDAAASVTESAATWMSSDVDVTGGSNSILPGLYGGAVATGTTIGDELPDAEVNRATTDRLTRGGVLSERDERRLREAAAQFNQDARSAIDQAAARTPLTLSDETVAAVAEAAGGGTDVETTVDTPIGEAEFDTERLGERNIERTQEAAAEAVATTLNPFALAQAGETGIEVASNLDDEVDTGDAATAAVAGSALAIGRETGAALATRARRDPTSFGGSLAGEVILGYGVGRGAGFLVRRGVDRARTVGGTRVDLEDVTNPDTAAYYDDPDADVGDEARFPGADDPDLYESDPAEAVRQQADEYTPAPIREDFEAAGVEEGTDLKKGIETEPEGQADPPSVGRGGGFRTEEGGYESPGAFAGPELSPNFLGVAGRSYSLRPGFPGLGGRPTGVIARTDVENPDADTMDAFNRELVEERTGDMTAVTKPADAVNTGEIEAIIPPGASFRAIDRATSGANRFGLGASYYTTVAGRRVPLRLVAPEDSVDTDAAAVDFDAAAQELGYYYRAADETVDRPAPTGSPGANDAGDTDATTGDESATEVDDDLLDAQPRDSTPDDDLLGVQEREIDEADRADASSDDTGDDLLGARPRDSESDAGRSMGSDDAEDDLLSVRPRDSDADSSRRSDADRDDDLLGVRERSSESDRRDRSERAASGSTGSGSGSRGRRDDDSYLAPLITSSGGPGRSDRSVFDSWVSTPSLTGWSIGGGPGTPTTPVEGPPTEGPPTEGPPTEPPTTPTEEPPTQPDRPRWDWNPDMGRDTDRYPERTEEDDRPLSVGYFNEFVADFAFGAAPTSTPTQSTLASFEGAEQYTEQLPTLRELGAEGSERTALLAAYDTFGASPVTVTTDEEGGLL
jgi:hypothetical protein